MWIVHARIEAPRGGFQGGGIKWTPSGSMVRAVNERREPKVPSLREEAVNEQREPKVPSVTCFLRFLFLAVGTIWMKLRLRAISGRSAAVKKPPAIFRA